ncbi:MAG TPA: hypothetical protein VGQ19_01355 [Burkholderiales bacterium]|nr:hypothetical protein [Burkholderiales bacterium]
MPLPPGAQNPAPVDINNTGTIVAIMGPVGTERGYVRAGTTWKQLDPLPGGSWSLVSAVNEVGQVAGYRNSDTQTLGFIWQNDVFGSRCT